MVTVTKQHLYFQINYWSAYKIYFSLNEFEKEIKFQKSNQNAVIKVALK